MKSRLVMLALLAGCGGTASSEPWPTDAVRAVVRQIDSLQSGSVTVDPLVLGSTQELPWGVQQSLTTAGFVVSDSAPRGSAHVSFAVPRRQDDAWYITVLVDNDTIGWLVRCDGDCVTSSGQ